MAAIDTGNNTSGKANVDSNYNLNVRTPVTASQAGFIAIAGKNDDGTITGTPLVNRGYVTEGNGLKIAIPVLLWDDTFNATAQNTSKYRAPATTQTVNFSSGSAIINGGNVTTINTNSALQTYRVFPLFAKSELRCNMSVLRTVAPQTNCVEEMGLFSASLPGASVPTDGIFFRWTTAGSLRGVISYNGVEFQTAAITSPSINVNHDYVIVTQTNTVRFYIDDILQSSINLLTDQPTLGQPFMPGSQPFTIRQYIGGSAPALANQLKISDVFITALGPDLARLWPHTKAGFGHMGYQGQNGGTMGSTANYANNANPTAAVATNTTAALGTGLGGQFWETVTIAANTDGIICSFQNPVPGVFQTGRNLIITGVTIHCFNQVALATVAFNSVFVLNYGHTALSLATAESTTAKAPRRIVIGVQQPATAVNTVYPALQIRFDTPIVVAPGEFVAISRKTVGTAPATGVIAHHITFDSYFE